LVFDLEGEHLWKALSARLPMLSSETRGVLRAEIVRLPETRDLPDATAPGDLIARLDTGAYDFPAPLSDRWLDGAARGEIRSVP
jgi:hypothetical protein